MHHALTNPQRSLPACRATVFAVLFGALFALSGCPSEAPRPAGKRAQAPQPSSAIEVIDATPGAPGTRTGAALSEAQRARLEGQIAALKKAATLEDAYRIAETVEDIGRAAAPMLEAAIAGVPELPRIAALRALYSLDRWDPAVSGLAAIAGGEGARETRLAAAELISALASPRHEEILKKTLDQTFDTPVRIELSLALWNTSKAARAKQELEELLTSDSENFRLQAALALGRLGDTSKARPVLRALAVEPSVRGRIAQAVLDREELLKELELAIYSDPTGAKKPVKVDAAILDDVQRMLQERYIYADRVTTQRLTLAAASGLLTGLDPYSVYFDESQLRRAAELREFRVKTLGISLGASPFRKGAHGRVLTIVAVTPDSPADQAGIRPGDQIFDIAPGATGDQISAWRHGKPLGLTESLGEKLYTLRLDDQVDALSGPAGSSVGVLMRRPDWLLARWIRLVYEEPREEKLHHEMLPGALAYVHVPALRAETPDLFAAALEACKKEKAKGLLIDVRDCTGGSYDAAARIAGMLLPADTLVAWSEGRNPTLAPRTELKATGDIHETKLPLALLINRGTADAAEVLAGALKDWERATLAGQTTYGRALMQEVFPLTSQDNKHALLLTVGRYFTPKSQRQLYDTGVAPDLEAARAEFEGWVYDELDDLRSSGALNTYVEGLLKADRVKAMELARGDGFDVSRYPGFAAFKAGLKNHLTDEHLRWAMRRELRTSLRASGMHGGVADLQTDAPFAAALRDLAKKAELDLSKFEEYKSLSR